MSKNLNETAKTLYKGGASSPTVQNALDKITKGMGDAGRNSVNTVAKIQAVEGATRETTMKTLEAKYQNKK